MLRTDGCTEYKPLSRLFPQLVHQTTCPCTPQQNGTAERKHRHIVELAIATTQHTANPLAFWDEVFSSTVFLINRLPSSHSSNSPYAILFNKPPDYTLLCVLGCLCFLYTCPYNDHKFQSRSLLCIFLGYYHLQKGYKCLHIPTNKIFISRHVVFDEETFPFRDASLSGTAISSGEVLMPLTSLLRRFSKIICSVAAIPTSNESLTRSADCSYPSSTPPNRSTDRSLISDCSTDRTHFSSDPPDRSTNRPPTTSFPPGDSQAPTSLHPMITRKPRQFPDYVAYLSTRPELEPLSFAQANTSPH